MNAEDPKYIIAIGASAGGLEELTTFFEHTPLDGVAYVIVQHLSPTYKSRMVELLSRHSQLQVVQAEEGMMLQKNGVYMIPSDKFMTIEHDVLRLTDKENIRGPHLTINTFFNSLAVNCGEKSIGIILSGLGSDGSEGIRSIKRAGGMAMAQDPQSAEFDSMPIHAIATDMIDFILEPANMPDAIEAFVKYADESAENGISDESVIKEIIAYIHEKLPFDFTDYKTTTIIRRTKRRAATYNIYSLGKYLLYLKENPDEVKALAKEFLISVTSFFRDPEAFEVIRNTVIPQLLKNIGSREEIKLWVAGCATGEEAYSLAILMKELLIGKLSDISVKIFATDIDATALAYAGKGIYPSDRINGIDSARLELYFNAVGNNYIVKPEIRKMLIFSPHDLVKNPPYCNMDFISCRNLLIYMTPTLQKKVYDMLLFGLKTNGYLMLGTSENPLTIIDNLEIISKKWRIYKNVKDKKISNFDAFSLPDLKNYRKTLALKSISAPINFSNSLGDTITETLADLSNCLAVCVDQESRVLKAYGNSTKYLITENFNNNLLELLPRPLAVAYNSLSKDAIRNDSKFAVNRIIVQHNKAVMEVNLSVHPVLIDGGRNKGLLVVFTENTNNELREDYPVFNEIDYNSKYTKVLEVELQEAKEKLVAAYDKLDTYNENLQSFNEELISANEEMQSANEEMQSVNEELHTINADYQLKNKELMDTNDDLNNYFRSNVNGQLFIDNDLRLVKFSPGAVKHINLLDTDIGRPIHHISTNIKLETIVDDATLVLKKGIVITKEIETTNGRWYQVMIMPYIQSNNERNGAIITFNDVDDLKKTQNELHRKNQSLTRINADLDHFIHAASHDLLAPLSNIEGSINLLNDLEILDTNFSEILSIINSSVTKFRALITDIAVIAKVESETSIKENINLDEILDNIEWSLKDKIESSGAVINRKLAIREIVFSKKNMRSILYNLISNAIKFKSDALPLITVTSFTDEDYCMLSVEDNGKGIAEDAHLKIFDLYGRLHQDIEGSGIGLHLAKKIINAAGGNIIVESEPGKGAKFTIYMNQEVLINQ